MRVILKKSLGWFLLLICLVIPAGYIWYTQANQELAYQVLAGTLALFLLALFASWLISVGERLS
ncbi:hypothetical protein ACFLT7_02145 [candidate division KSB1 bacterium]